MYRFCPTVRRTGPAAFYRVKSVAEAKRIICDPVVEYDFPIELIDIDHDAGIYAQHGGDYIKLLDWLEETGHSLYIVMIMIVGK